MEIEINKEYGSEGATVQSVLERGAENYEEAKEAAAGMYAKTVKAAGDALEQTKSYGSSHPGKAILISLGIGTGVGYLLGSGSRNRTERIARPVARAISTIAKEFMR